MNKLTAEQLDVVRLKLDGIIAASIDEVESKGIMTPGDKSTAGHLRATVIGIHEAVASAADKGAGVDAITAALLGYTMVFAAARKREFLV